MICKKCMKKGENEMKIWKRLVCTILVAFIFPTGFFSQGAALEVTALKEDSVETTSYSDDIGVNALGENNVETAGIGDIPEEVLQEFDSVIIKYSGAIDSINDYVEEYIEDNGRINMRFRLPYDLRVEFNTIVDGFDDGVGDTSFEDDGRNDILIFPYLRLQPLDLGMGHYVWTDHLFTQLVAEYMPFGAAVIAAILDVAFGYGCTQKFLFFIASFIDTLSASTADEVIEKDDGLGIRWSFLDSYLMSSSAIIDILELESQPCNPWWS